MGLIRNLDTDCNRRTIVGNLVRMCEDMHIQVIAEGVETQQQLDILRGLGCDEVQGYHLGRPMPAQAFTALLCTGP